MTGMTHTRSASSALPASLVCIALCMAAMLWVFALNGNPLFYYDSLDYVLRGSKALALVLPDSWLRDPLAEAERLSGAAIVRPEATDHLVNASRSIVYSMLMAGFYQLHLQSWFPLFHAACVLAVIWVATRVLLRARGVERPALPVLVVPFLVAGLGSMPFYVGYLMPDIFAALILLSAGVITLHGNRMVWGEWLILLAISGIGVLSHPSHLLLSAAMVPGAALVGWVASRPGARGGAVLGPLFLICLVALAVTERLAFISTVKTVQKQEVIYYPFLTARMIADGPGLRYLQDNCPDVAIPTCLLNDALQGSDDPMRLTATHIIFATEPRIASFRLLSSQDQKKVADAQVDFARAVALDRPAEVLGAIVRNTGVQLLMNGVDMTVPDQSLVEKTAPGYPWLEPSRLSHWRGWLVYADPAQAVLNGVAALLLVAVVLWPGRFTRTERCLAVFVLMGVLANAFVCGAISQPATRYGARVIWLLPLVATFLLVLQGRLGKGRAR